LLDPELHFHSLARLITPLPLHLSLSIHLIETEAELGNKKSAVIVGTSLLIFFS
jgi:hypothetical protein